MAAAMLCSGGTVESFDIRYEGNRPKPIGYFTIVGKEVGKVQSDYLSKRSRVEPTAFQSAFRDLKSLLSSSVV
jgi:hypothetical protein